MKVMALSDIYIPMIIILNYYGFMTNIPVNWNATVVVVVVAVAVVVVAVVVVVWRIIRSCGLVEFYGGTEAVAVAAVAVVVAAVVVAAVVVAAGLELDG